MLNFTKGESDEHTRILIVGFMCALAIGGLAACRSAYHSTFADQAVKPTQLVKMKYRTLKSGAVGESTGFKFLWIPFASPSEADSKRDMLDRLQKERIDTTGKNIAFTNVTSDMGGFGFIGLIGAPRITLIADVIEILGEASPQVSPQN